MSNYGSIAYVSNDDSLFVEEFLTNTFNGVLSSKILVLNGDISSGKTTFLKNVQKNNSSKIVFVPSDFILSDFMRESSKDKLSKINLLVLSEIQDIYRVKSLLKELLSSDPILYEDKTYVQKSWNIVITTYPYQLSQLIDGEDALVKRLRVVNFIHKVGL